LCCALPFPVPFPPLYPLPSPHPNAAPRTRRLSRFPPARAGDKTFCIAAVMAMRYNRVFVFAGALGALIVMTILSVAIGAWRESGERGAVGREGRGLGYFRQYAGQPAHALRCAARRSGVVLRPCPRSIDTPNPAPLTPPHARAGVAVPTLLSRTYTHYAAACLFAYFGYKLIREASEMTVRAVRAWAGHPPTRSSNSG
jgi:hypothetical protein